MSFREVGKMAAVITLAIGTMVPATARELRLDGIFRVKGMSMEGARVIVVSGDEAPRYFMDHPSRIALKLDLQKEYLISFERPGCISKQLLFNTVVPSGYSSAGGFDFPFSVTLETLPRGESMEYAGPVGYIHFDERTGEFGYSTDYRIAKHGILTDRLEEARVKLDGGSKITAARTEPAKMVRTEAAPTGTAPAQTVYERTAPTLSRVAPMVHVLETPAPADDAPGSTGRASGSAGPAARPAGGRSMAEPVMGEERPGVATGGSTWESEVRKEPLHVITILTHREGEKVTEYRRVVSYYGGVTYFRNGQPCSAERYWRETGQ